jgi:ribose transport system permease protein
MCRALDRTLQRIVFPLALVPMAVSGAILPDFFTADNFPWSFHAVSALGIFGVAMALVVISRSIDLSLVSLHAELGRMKFSVNRGRAAH